MSQRTKVSLGYGVFCRNLGLSSGKALSARSNPHFEEVLARARTNMDCTVRILGWNYTNGFCYFRMSDHMVPQLYRSDALDICARLKSELHEMRRVIDEWNMRVTFHFTNLAFTTDAFTKRGHDVRVVRYATVLEALGENAWMECHLGPHKPGTDWLQSLIANFKTLPLNVQRKITFENDATWSPYDTSAACRAVHVPFTYDIEHHRLYARTRVSDPPTRFTSEDVEWFVAQSAASWQHRDAWATLHVSTPVDPDASEDHHADFVTFEDYARLRRAVYHNGGKYYIVIEAKGMDDAAVQLQREVTGRRPVWAVKDTSGSWV